MTAKTIVDSGDRGRGQGNLNELALTVNIYAFKRITITLQDTHKRKEHPGVVPSKSLDHNTAHIDAKRNDYNTGDGEDCVHL